MCTGVSGQVCVQVCVQVCTGVYRCVHVCTCVDRYNVKYCKRVRSIGHSYGHSERNY